MKKTHVPCSLKIEEEAVRYDLDNPTKRNTAKLLQFRIPDSVCCISETKQ